MHRVEQKKKARGRVEHIEDDVGPDHPADVATAAGASILKASRRPTEKTAAGVGRNAKNVELINEDDSPVPFVSEEHEDQGKKKQSKYDDDARDSNGEIQDIDLGDGSNSRRGVEGLQRR